MKLKFLDVIKYEGNNDTLVWKHPSEDFNTSSTLIVHETQNAVFFKNGQIADVLGPGRYPLRTANIPVLRRLLNLPTGGVSTFHCEVYFVNMTEVMALKWGTNGKIQFIEPNYNFPMELGASGEMSIRIRDARTFLTRLVGTEKELTPDVLVRYFRSLMMTRVKSYLARYIKEQSLNIFEIDSQLDILSDAMKERMVQDFAEYGVDLVQFFISTVVRPEDDPEYIRLRKATRTRYTDIFEAQTRQQVDLIRQQTEAQKRVLEAQSIAEKRRLEGYTYQEERGFDVAQQIAGNESSGQFSSLGIGLGMMAGVGGAIGGSMSNLMSGALGSMTGNMPQGNMPQGAMPQGNMPQGAMPQGNMPQGTMPQGNMPQGNTPQENAPQMSGQQENGAGTRLCKCGAALQPGARFCHVCGAEQPAVCPNCGRPVAPGSNFCAGCGQKL